MTPLTSGCLRYDGSSLFILDQSLLPHQEVWQCCDDVPTLIELMRRLAIRGAPAIGVAAALLLAVCAERGRAPHQLRADALRLRDARPTAYNLMGSIDRLLPLMTAADYPRSLVQEAVSIHREDVESCARMALSGARLLGDSEKILTICNTGSLATAGEGTAFGVIARAQREGKRPFVWVAETRPLLQGGRLTAWECLQAGIEHRIICDSAAPALMRQGMVQRVLVGSDRIAANGDFANKIGTYALAVAARYHRIPFYVVAPVTTVDPGCPNGEAIPIEQRDAQEIRGVSGAFGCCRWAPERSEVANPAFDITPAGLVTAWILDSGLYLPEDIGPQSWWQRKRGQP
ncbi:S-methyl-5-thioribose-1-phosphate isomerase [Desulfofustis limnaeus]|jgi:methylthioribose-1-phosphate isomerase|uniref:Methylthioribose-1-phosphate isomerase n=1 Tax=Desulfofustis limnaeus TaxID=2740163 RepID=A0ABM7WBE2_9BACT|nr:S-methyl-5-thioribose-1-phosphate isomerase [Desulfofustis limnaeus]MDX9894527.1 S-methyl-5-thioribose-1-phosphate isomerase [Desulfofustis sp.]BDD88308.1 methylthioribose-1-phosphate isomerase [Desulfofustis limnaeus]